MHLHFCFKYGSSNKVLNYMLDKHLIPHLHSYRFLPNLNIFFLSNLMMFNSNLIARAWVISLSMYAGFIQSFRLLKPRPFPIQPRLRDCVPHPHLNSQSATNAQNQLSTLLFLLFVTFINRTFFCFIMTLMHGLFGSRKRPVLIGPRFVCFDQYWQ